MVPILWCLTAAVLFGASTPASKFLLGELGPFTLAGLLYLGAGLATLPAAWRGGSATRRRDPANVRRLLGAILFGGVLGPLALLWGLTTAPAAHVALWLNGETTATAILAWFFFRENLSARGWLANGLVVVAGVLLAVPDGFALAPPALLVGIACCCWGLDNNLTAVIDGYTPAQTTAAKGWVAGLVNLSLGLLLESGAPAFLQVLLAMSVGALAYGASIVLYIRGAQQLGATRSQMLFSTAPFLGVLLSWGLLGEPIAAVQLCAVVLLTGALVLLFTEHHSHEHRHEAMTHTHAHRHDDGHHTHTHPGLPLDVWHTHEHAHAPVVHTHPHVPDLHHRHTH